MYSANCFDEAAGSPNWIPSMKFDAALFMEILHHLMGSIYSIITGFAYFLYTSNIWFWCPISSELVSAETVVFPKGLERRFPSFANHGEAWKKRHITIVQTVMVPFNPKNLELTVDSWLTDQFWWMLKTPGTAPAHVSRDWVAPLRPGRVAHDG